MSESIDPKGRIIVDPEKIFSILYHGAKPKELICETTEEIQQYNALCALWGKPDEIIHSNSLEYVDPDEDRKKRISDWKIPDEYSNLDVKTYLISKCKTAEQIKRVEMEMELYQEKNLIQLLRLMIALVAHFREKNIVWGIGRGSSVSSYCLFLIGVHKIDSIKYGLDVKEFLR